MAPRKKTPDNEVELSFTASQRQLLGMMERCSAAEASKLLIQAKKARDDADPRGEIVMTAAGQPLSVVTRIWSGDQTEGSALVHYAGQCVLNIKDFRSLVSAMPDDLLDIECNKKGRVTIEAAGFSDKPRARSFTVQSLDAEDYPPVPDFPLKGVTRTLPGKLLREAIERVRYAADDANSTESFSGVLIAISKGRLEAVGTSGRCMAVFRSDAPVVEPNEEYLLPRDMLSICCALGEIQASIDLAQDEQRIYLNTEHTLITCLRSVGAYPQWRVIENAMAESAVALCTLDSLQLAEALRALGTVWRLSYISSDDRSRHGAPAQIDLEHGEIVVSAGFEPAGAKLAGSQEALAVSNPDEHKLSCTVESTILMRGAQQAKGVATLRAKPFDDGSPIVIESTDGSFSAITVPRMK